jgi:hypothetical protein
MPWDGIGGNPAPAKKVCNHVGQGGGAFVVDGHLPIGVPEGALRANCEESAEKLGLSSTAFATMFVRPVDYQHLLPYERYPRLIQ